jgi:hypothetical protein
MTAFGNYLKNLWNKTVAFFKCMESTIKLVIKVVAKSWWNIILDAIKTGKYNLFLYNNIIIFYKI